MFNYAYLNMIQVQLLDNRATMIAGGGAIATFDSTTAILTDCLIQGSTVYKSGGGAIAAFGAGPSLVTLSGCVIRDNHTPDGSTGGFYCESFTKVLITNGTLFQNNTGAVSIAENCSAVINGGTRMLDNTAAAGLGGGALAVMDRGKAVLSGGVVIKGNSAWDGPGGGGIFIVSESVVVLDSVHILENKASIGGGVHATGPSTVIIRNGTVIHNNTAAVGSDLIVGPIATLSLEDATFDPYESTVLWQRTNCIPGEVLDQGVCRKCIPSTYNLVPSPKAVCQVCPDHATCPVGGDVIVPLAGYWNSNRYSTQMHRCPHVDQVCGINNTCAAGYGGNLCGVCEAGYGPSAAFSCGKCMSIGVQWVLYLAAGLLAVLLVAFTVHCTWRDNQQTASNQQTLRSSDFIKVLILFLQYLVIISSLSVPWPTSLAYLFRFAKFIFAASNGQLGSVSLECVLSQGHPSSVPASIQRQLIYLVAPVGILAGVLLLFSARMLLQKAVQAARGRWYSGTGRRGSSTSSAASSNSNTHFQRASLGSMLLQKLPLMCVVTFFFAYPFLVRVSLGMFACLQIDKADAADDPYPQFAVANASRGYWVHAMQQACFEGWHLPWALALGLPCVLLFCVATPLALLIGLMVNKSKLQRSDVRSHFGFLYRPYLEKRCWWEGVMTVQTMLLVMISVFRFTLGGYYSALLVTVMFSAMATFQLVFKPFASRKLHVMQLVATGCLYITSCIALSLFNVDVDNNPVFQDTIGAVAVFLNVVFVVWCCYCILMESQGVLGRVFAALKRLCAKCCPRLVGSSGSSSSSSIPTPGACVVKLVENAPSSSDGDGDADQGNKVIAPPSPTQMPALPVV
jgi:hypothetical protein